MMTLHTIAWGIGIIAALCAAVPGPRGGRLQGLALSGLMVLAMADVMFIGMLSATLWAAVLVAAAMVASMGVRRARPRAVRVMRAVDAVGVVLMAGLLLTMSGTGTATSVLRDVGHHAHAALSPDASLFACLLAIACTAHLVVCARLARGMRHPQACAGAPVRSSQRRWNARATAAAPVAMSASTVVMATALFV